MKPTPSNMINCNLSKGHIKKGEGLVGGEAPPPARSITIICVCITITQQSMCMHNIYKERKRKRGI